LTSPRTSTVPLKGLEIEGASIERINEEEGEQFYIEEETERPP